MKMPHFLIFLIALNCLETLSAPMNGNVDFDDMTVPDRKIVDFNDLKPSELEQLTRNNINITALRIKQEALKATIRSKDPRSAPVALKQGVSLVNTSGQSLRKEFESRAIDMIKDNLQHNLMRNESTSQIGTTHEIAFPAVCDIPKNTNETQWFDGFTWNLYFQVPNKSFTYVNSAILRLFKLGTDNRRDGAVTENCKDQNDQLLRITVSVYSKKSRKDNISAEKKKRMCSSTTVPRSYKGWIAMDTMLAIKLWDKPNRNLGIAIDVTDQDDNPLKAAQFFNHHDCTEASVPILPWSYFGSSLFWTSNEMVNVPHSPRIDVALNKAKYFNRRMYRQNHHNKNLKYHLDATASSSSSSSSKQSHEYSIDDLNFQTHHDHANNSHKKRHLQHRYRNLGHQAINLNSNESDEDDQSSTTANNSNL